MKPHKGDFAKLFIHRRLYKDCWSFATKMALIDICTFWSFPLQIQRVLHKPQGALQNPFYIGAS